MSLRLCELVISGALGDIRRADMVLAIPAPPDTNPRWSRDLAGGATMDLGCYVLDAARPRVTGTEGSATAPAFAVPHMDKAPPVRAPDPG